MDWNYLQEILAVKEVDRVKTIYDKNLESKKDVIINRINRFMDDVTI